MASPEKSHADNVFDALVEIARIHVRNKTESVGDNFPTLKDGSKGLKIGYSLGYSRDKILRPDGSLVWVDYRTHEQKGLMGADWYVDRMTLNEVEQAVNGVLESMQKNSSKPESTQDNPL